MVPLNTFDRVPPLLRVIKVYAESFSSRMSSSPLMGCSTKSWTLTDNVSPGILEVCIEDHAGWASSEKTPGTVTRRRKTDGQPKRNSIRERREEEQEQEEQEDGEKGMEVRAIFVGLYYNQRFRPFLPP